MERADWHIYQVLTKRSSLLQKFTNERYRPAPRRRISGLAFQSKMTKRPPASLTCKRPMPASRFLSVEPLIGPVGKLNLSGIDWVIVGGESGPRARPMQTQWAIDIRNQCLNSKVAFFFKQWGGAPEIRRPSAGGKEWNEFPMKLAS